MSDFLQIKQVDGLSTELAAKALDSAVVKKANNLSDVNASTARTNLSIYSRSEVDALISGASNAYNVADTTARNALTGLKVTDRVFVNNDGDSKWALYLVTAVTTGTGSTSTFKKIADEDIFTNAISAAAVKAAYESNADTFVYNGAAKDKVDRLTVSAPINLDTVKTTADNALAAAGTAQTTATNAASAASAAQTTANNAVTAAGTAQTTATNAASAASAAQTTANGKEDAFTQTVEHFTGLTGSANTAVNVTVTQTPKTGFIPSVYFNGIRVRQVTNSQGTKVVAYTVPYATVASDNISVVYQY